MPTKPVVKHKLTNAEVALVNEFLDAFETSGFAYRRNHGTRSERYINRYGMRFEVLQAMAQSAVIDYVDHFRMIHGHTDAKYSILLDSLMHFYKDDARITYDEGDGTIDQFKVRVAFNPPSEDDRLYFYEAGWIDPAFRKLLRELFAHS